jgi:hypothetical protein
MLIAREGHFFPTHEASSTGAPSFHHRRCTKEASIPGAKAMLPTDSSNRALT